MKMKKILCLIFCTLMIINILPALGSSNIEQPPFEAPQPGYATIPYEDAQIVRKPIEITAANMNDIVISMIEQVDESIYLNYLEDIVGFGPRRTGTSSCIAAAAYIFEQFESMGLDVRYHHWTNGGYTSDNVEATINGTDETSDEIYIICGHYDTVASSPGADDDASGTVATLVAAYFMSQYMFNHTIKFVTFSGEEEGLLGSEVYAQEADAQNWNIAGVLNCDMISYAITEDDGNNLVVYQNTASQWLYTYTMNVNSEYSEYIGSLTLHNGGTSSGSDHYYFWQHGFSAVFYFEYEMTPYYHGSGDTIDHINATYAVKNIRLILATLAELAEAGYPSNAPGTPTISGPTFGVINEEYFYNATTTDPDGDDVYYYIDWGDGTNTDWIGPYPSGAMATITYTWTDVGVYEVLVRAKDVWGVRSEWSIPLIVTIVDNTPPTAPEIQGPTSIKPLREYEYTFVAVDPQNQDVNFDIDWGDGHGSSNLGPYASGEDVTMKHVWKIGGKYTIKVRATDVLGAESPWTYLEISVPRAKISSFIAIMQQIFQRFPNLFFVLKNLMEI